MSIQLNTVQTLGAAAIIALLIGSLSAFSITNLTAPDEYKPEDHDHEDLEHDHEDLMHDHDHTHEPATGEGGMYTFTFEAYLSGYVGVGGAIDGKVNPILQVDAYSNVTIILLAGDSRRHDFVIDELVQSGEVDPDENVDEITVNFSAGPAGESIYYCSITGHYATMNGLFIVGDSGNLPEPAKNLDVNVIKKPDEIPAPVGARAAMDVEITIVTKEVTAKLDDGTSFTFWTFNGTVPGPMIRVRIGDNVTIHLKNEATSNFTHSVDFHAVNANGGGAAYTQAAPGTTESFWFIPEWEGAFVYHCASPHIPTHISKGMYG
ncbi:MAG: multicopper oxidase domain-containing protein, partial [Candidatus Kariarchaeaceae archaeon]